MAERVVNVGFVPGADTRRVRAILARYPGGSREARGISPRDEAGLFQLLTGLKGRLPVTRVTSHVCRHDEGEGICTVDREG